MGKAEIVSNAGKGQYGVKILWDRTRALARIAKLTTDIAWYDATITTLAAELVALRIAYEAAKVAVSPPTPFSELAAMASAINAKQANHDLYLVERSSKSKMKKLLEAIPVDPAASAWCADYSTALTGNVGTIEPNGEPSGFIVRPGYQGAAAYSATRDGQIQNVMSNTPEGTFYNKALMPGWQKWKPTFRIGTLTSINTTLNTCELTLDTKISREQPEDNLDINQGTALVNVPIVYMSCNSRAFAVNDRVVVEFTDKDFTKPTVIGFESNPKPCTEYFVWKVDLYSGVPGGTHIVVVWDIEGNKIAEGLGFTSPCLWTDAGFQAWWATYPVAKRIETQDYFELVSHIERQSNSVSPTVPSHPTQWEYSRHIPSYLPEALPGVYDPIAYIGDPEGLGHYHHDIPDSLEPILQANVLDDAYVYRLRSTTGDPDPDNADSITTHMRIKVYGYPTGSAGAELLNSDLYTRNSSPKKYWWHRSQVEDLYNTNWVDGTRELWTEKYFTPFGLISTFQGANNKIYTMQGDYIYNWARYDYYKKSWEWSYVNTPRMQSWVRSSANSLVIVAIIQYQEKIDSYYTIDEHTVGGELIPFFESPHTITYGDRVLEVVSMAISDQADVKIPELPAVDNAGLTAAVKACYAKAYEVAGVIDPKADHLTYAIPYLLTN